MDNLNSAYEYAIEENAGHEETAVRVVAVRAATAFDVVSIYDSLNAYEATYNAISR